MPDLVAAVAEPNRRRLLQLLGRGEQTVTVLAGNFTVSRSAISQHLGVLREAELVIERRDGTRRLYRANRDEMARVRTFLDEYWTGGLQRLKEAAEAATDEQDREH